MPKPTVITTHLHRKIWSSLDITRRAKKNNINVGLRWSHIAVEPINACHPSLIDLYFMRQLSIYPTRTGVLPAYECSWWKMWHVRF